MKKLALVLVSVFLCFVFMWCNLWKGDISRHPEVDLAMEAYKKVLLNEKEFFNASDDKNYYLYDYYCSMFEDYYDYLTVDQVRERLIFSVTDIDGNEMPEIVLNFWAGMDVFQYKDGIVYGHWVGELDMKKDGSFYWRDGWMWNGYARYIFMGEQFTSIDLGYSECDSYEECRYFIDDVQVTEAEYRAFEAIQDAEEELEYHEFTEENIKNLDKLYDPTA